jgi:glycosyltransferase involved in cell wall biosynthesis
MMSNYRFVQISGSYPPMTCGIADYTSSLSQHLTARGAEVEVWTKRNGQPRDGVRECVSAWDREGFKTLWQTIRREKPALVHLQYEPGIYNRNPAISLLPFVTRRLGVPLVTTFHALDGPSQWGKAHRLALLPLLLGSADITVCSQRQLSALQRIGTVQRKTALIPVGSSVEVAPGLTDKENSGPEVRLVYFGFVWRGRNIETCLRALAAVAKSQPASLDIVGGIRDDEYLNETRRLAEQLRVGDRVRFTGDLPAAEISHVLQRSHVALLPFSSGVSTGRTTLMAALAHHLPVVTYGAPDNLSEAFRHGDNMMIASQDDEGEFVRCAQALANNTDLRAHMAASAAQLSEHFSWTNIAEQVLQLPSYSRLSDARLTGGNDHKRV